MRTIRLPAAEVQVFPDSTSLSRGVAQFFLRQARAAIDARGRFTAALAGGSTPKAVYRLIGSGSLAEGQGLDWHAIDLFLGDERHVSSDDPDSNFRMVSEALLPGLPALKARVHRVRSELEPAAAAADYEVELRKVFATDSRDFPRFDLILLGMGTDGHTASLFPESTALGERSALVTATWVDKFKSYRITFTLPLINAASEVVFIVSGAEKAAMLGKVLAHTASAEQGDPYPAQCVKPQPGRLIWMIDEPAASELGN